MNHNYMKKVDELYLEKMKHKGTITTLNGINKNIDKTDTDIVPTKDSSVQTMDATNNTITQHQVVDKVGPNRIETTIQNQTAIKKQDLNARKNLQKQGPQKQDLKKFKGKKASEGTSRDEGSRLLRSRPQSKGKKLRNFSKDGSLSKQSRGNPSEEHSEDTDEDINNSNETGESNLMDALSADSNLKREVSEEVNAEFLKEERL